MKPTDVHQYFVVTRANFPDTFLAAMDGNPDFAHGVRLIAEWLVEAEKRSSSSNGFLCLDCDTMFGKGESGGFLIVLPVFKGEYGMVTGICRHASRMTTSTTVSCAGCGPPGRMRSLCRKGTA